MRDRFNAPLEFDRRCNGFRYSDTSFEIPGHWISETNVLALSLAVRLASTIPDPSLKDDLCRLINRVTRVTGNDEQNCLQRVDRMISVKNIEYALVDTAIFRQTVVAVLRARLIDQIDDKFYSLRFYFLGSNWKQRMEQVRSQTCL